MSTFPARMSGPIGGAHPVVLNRRIRELVLIGASALIPLALGLAISIAVPNPSFLLLLALAVGGLGIVALMASPNYAMTLTIVVLYLGLLEGPVKLGSGAHATAAVVRDVLIAAISLGALLRLLVSRERVKLPAMGAWVLAFVALVLIEAFNPKTNGLLKTLGGFRQQLEWVPFFFFGYLLMRSKQRFRRLFLLLGVLALANGMVSTYQARLSPGQLASWGPGYRELVFGTTGLDGRTFSSEGVTRVRPPALGTDAGFGGGVGVVALPGLFVLLASGRLRRRWPVLLLALGAMIAVATGLGRLQMVGGVLAVIVFSALSLTTGRRIARPLLALLGVMVLAIPAGVFIVSLEGSGTFSRYATVTSGKDTKTTSLTHIPTQLAAAPFGVGLGTVGAAAGFGGKQKELLEGHGVSAETEYNFLSDELGLPGLLLWVALSVRLITLAFPGLRRIRDFELRLDLTALFSSIIAFTIMGFSGPTMTSAAFGPFFWFTAGVFAYWFAGPGRRTLTAEQAVS